MDATPGVGSRFVWSAIARGVIRDRRQLRALGFARGASTTNSEE